MNKNSKLRLLGLLFLLALLLVLGKFTALKEWFEPEVFISAVKNAGVWGALIYIILFCVGLLLYMPGVLFILIAVILYGPLYGMLVSYIASFIAVTINFYFVRLVGGKALSEVEHPLMMKMMKNIESKPIMTMVILRVLFWLSPILNSVLALSRIKPSQYHLGNLVGLILPVAIFSLGFHYFNTLFVSYFIK